MRTLKIISTFLILITFFSLQSCSSDDDAGTQNPDTYIRFTINGTDYEFENILTAESSSITLNGNNGSSLTDTGDTRIAIWLPIDVQAGTFDVESGFDAEYQVSFTSEPLGFDFDFADSGAIVVTSVSSEYIEGTFTATITKDNTTLSLTNGSFKGLGI